MYVEARFNEWIDDNSRTLLEGDLVDGRKYGVFSASPNANARNPKTDVWYRNHGDLYVICWTWNEKSQSFFTENAWGVVSELKPAAIRHPIIEFP